MATPGSDPPAGPPAALRAAVALAFVALLALPLMLGWVPGAYPWVKSLHVIAIIAWMAGLLYLPRLFIYHCEAPEGSQQSETFKVMERRLLRIIMDPAMVLAWVLGLWLAWAGGYFSAHWFHGKLFAVVLMTGVHAYFTASVRRFGAGQNDKPARHWRMWNEVPTVLMVVIVILVIVKPF